MRPTTLAEAAAIPNGRISFECTYDRCRHKVTRPAAEVLAEHGDMTMEDLKRRARCSYQRGGCGLKMVRVLFWVDVWA